MTQKELASIIAKREGKKHQASVGDIREILKIMFDIDMESGFEVTELFAMTAYKKKMKLKQKK